jgi:GNAT superfamily N-acetyltransferase
VKLEVRPLTPDRWDDFVAVMGSNGAYAGCWCMWWRVWPRKKFGTTAGERGPKLRRAMRSVVRSGEPPGVVAYIDGEPAAWCSIAPRESYEALQRSRAYAPIDDREVWSVVCFYAAKPFRGAGLMPKLLRAASEYAFGRGARIVEGYPSDPKGKAAPVDLYMGTARTFRTAGFREVGRTTNGKPIMRKTARAKRAR